MKIKQQMVYIWRAVWSSPVQDQIWWDTWAGLFYFHAFLQWDPCTLLNKSSIQHGLIFFIYLFLWSSWVIEYTNYCSFVKNSCNDPKSELFFLQKYKIVKVFFEIIAVTTNYSHCELTRYVLLSCFFFSCHQAWYIPHEKEENKRMIKTKSNQTHCKWIVTRSYLYICTARCMEWWMW